MIKLGMYAGYNSYNEMRFSNASARDNFFDSHVTYTIDAYYPPYYTNVIKIDKSEVPQTARINFVILVHDSKYYYYFVDHMNYINEDIYEIVINMDTIMTYQFDLLITQGLITRKSISRWVYEDSNYKINRNYVRENVSEGIMEVSSFEYRNPNKYLIVASDEKYLTGSIATPTIRDGFNHYDVGYYVYVFPLPTDAFDVDPTTSIRIYNENFQLIKTVLPADYVSIFIDDPHTINMMLVESDYLDKYLGTTWGLEHDGTSLYLTLTLLGQNFNDSRVVKIDNTYYGGIMFGTYDLSPIKLKTINSEFVRNSSLLVPFNYTFVPQLFDENYMQIEYGDITGFTSYPLHQSKSISLNIYNSTDITNGNNAYYILDTGIEDNRHKTNIISLGLTFDLITDPWKEYQAQNKGTLSTGLQLQAVNTLYSTAKGIATVGAGSGVSSASSLRTYYNLEKHTVSVTAKDSDSTKMPNGSLTPLSDGLMQGMNIIANYQINKENLEYSPDTVKGRGDVHSMIMTRYKSPYILIHKVNDLVNCAKKLEEFGYRVNEIFSGPSYIQDLCINRTYYNCISMRVKTYTQLCFIPNDIINDMIARLENGLRFFDMNNIPSGQGISTILDYDNVER